MIPRADFSKVDNTYLMTIEKSALNKVNNYMPNNTT